jgi:hypothetical protein
VEPGRGVVQWKPQLEQSCIDHSCQGVKLQQMISQMQRSAPVTATHLTPSCSNLCPKEAAGMIVILQRGEGRIPSFKAD